MMSSETPLIHNAAKKPMKESGADSHFKLRFLHRL
jgi:hypothetical protein